MAIRTPRGYAVYHKPLQEIFEGKRPSLDGLKNLLPAPWLPVSRVDQHHDDPQVIPAGTAIGRINATDHTGEYQAVTSALRTDFVVPASANTGEYTVTYTTDDVTYLTPDVDDYPTVVSAAGASTLTVGPVKPLGIVTQDIYASHMSATWTNYIRQHMITFLSWGYCVLIPVLTADEALLQPGDLVQIDDNDHAATTWQPKTPQSNVVGRYKPWASGDSPEYKIGRVLEKITLANQTASVATQNFQAAVTAGNYSSAHDFSGLAKVQTVPGLGLSGSGTAGVPKALCHAMPQGQVYYALLISISAL